MDTQTTTTPAKFEAGRTYYTRSLCDGNCIFEITVSSRTAKTIRTSDGKTFRIAINYAGAERVAPLGRYSLAPHIDATQTTRPLTDWERCAV